MSTLPFFFENAWRWKCGLPEIKDERMPESLERIRKIQWSTEFENAVRSVVYDANQGSPNLPLYKKRLDWFFHHAMNRMVMGAFRYGLVGSDHSTSHDHLSSIPKRYRKFWVDFNVEYLLDIYNLFMLNWIDTGKCEKMNITQASATLRLYMSHYNRLQFVSIDDDDCHSQKK